VTTRLHGRPAATTASRTHRVLLRLSLSLVLCAPALSVFAAPIDDAAPFPTKASVAKPAAVEKTKPELTTAAAAPQSQSLSDRALSLAAGMNRLVSPLAPLALDLPDEAIGEPIKIDGDGKIATVLQKALALLGTPYRWGGTDPDKGFDCSGLVGYVFRNALGIELPRVSRDMAKNGELITDRAKLAAGDLVFFGRKGRVNHVGIYVGDGRFVHAPRRGRDVTVSSLDSGYWGGRFVQARRVSTDGT
jgi:cell wall-associated NlpC family hydrolase